VTKSALVATLYVNGVQAGQLTNLPLYPARLGNTPSNWLGRSQNAADPFLDGLVDEVRIYQRGLTAAEVGALADGTPPSTTASVTPSPVNGWYPATPTVTLTATDDVSGVERTERRLDGGDWQTVTAPFTVTGEGVHTVEYRSVDRNGNVEQTRVLELQVDTQPPVVTYTGNAGSYTVDRTIEIDCTARDPVPGSGLVADTCADVSRPAYTFALGEHTLRATARDLAGHVAEASTTFVVRVTFASLKALVTRFCTNAEVANSLNEKLDAAAAKTSPAGRRNRLKAFENQVEAQVGKSLTAEQGEVLVRLARALR
jgi:hypothetical protein